MHHENATLLQANDKQLTWDRPTNVCRKRDSDWFGTLLTSPDKRTPHHFVICRPGMFRTNH